VLDFQWASAVVLGLMTAALLIVIQQAVCPRPARLGRGVAASVVAWPGRRLRASSGAQTA
jgi:hypothetical protein